METKTRVIVKRVVMDMNPIMIGALLALVSWMMVMTWVYAFGPRTPSYCHFYPTVCVQNGGVAPDWVGE